MQVDERHMHRSIFRKAQRKQKQLIQQAYEEIAQDRANAFVDQVRAGDLSFGAGQTVIPVPQAQPLLAAPVQSSGSSGSGVSRVWPANTGIP